MAISESELTSTVGRLLRRQRLLAVLLATVTVIHICVTAAGWRELQGAAHPQKLTLRRLDIVDEEGKQRVVLAAPAPPPTYLGKPGKREGAVLGVLLFDSTGTERGGYVTNDGDEGNALLTLDAQGR